MSKLGIHFGEQDWEGTLIQNGISRYHWNVAVHYLFLVKDDENKI